MGLSYAWAILLAGFRKINLNIIKIILCVLSDQIHVFVGDLAAHLGRHSSPQRPRRNHSLFRHHRTCGNDAAVAYPCVVQHPRTHANYHHIAHRAAMHCGIVANGDPVAHDYWIEVPLPVQHGAVLHVGVGPHANRVHVAPDYRVHPYRRSLAEDNIAEDLCRGVNVTTGGNNGRTALVTSDHRRLTLQCTPQAVRRLRWYCWLAPGKNKSLGPAEYIENFVWSF